VPPFLCQLLPPVYMAANWLAGHTELPSLTIGNISHFRMQRLLESTCSIHPSIQPVGLHSLPLKLCKQKLLRVTVTPFCELCQNIRIKYELATRSPSRMPISTILSLYHTQIFLNFSVLYSIKSEHSNSLPASNGIPSILEMPSPSRFPYNIATSR
jgi:hypothetical protein